MDEWTISYQELNIFGLAVHGVITVRDGNGNVVNSFEGLATSSSGTVSSIGSALLGYTIQGYDEAGLSPNAESTPTTVFSGTQQQVEARVQAMDSATNLINSENIDYELPGPGSIISTVFGGNGTNTNSNSYISTMFEVLGLPVPASPYTTLLGQEGGDAKLLTPGQIQSITAPYGGTSYSSVPASVPTDSGQEAPQSNAYVDEYQQSGGTITSTTLTDPTQSLTASESGSTEDVAANGSGFDISLAGGVAATITGPNNTITLDSGDAASFTGSDTINVDGTGIAVNAGDSTFNLQSNSSITVNVTGGTSDSFISVPGAVAVALGVVNNYSTSDYDNIYLNPNSGSGVAIYSGDADINSTHNVIWDFQSNGSVDVNGGEDQVVITGASGQITVSNADISVAAGLAVTIYGSNDDITGASNDYIKVDGDTDHVSASGSEIYFSGGDDSYTGSGDTDIGGTQGSSNGGDFSGGYYGYYGFAGSKSTVQAAVGANIGSIAQHDLATDNYSGAVAAEAALIKVQNEIASGTTSDVLGAAKWDQKVVTWSTGSPSTGTSGEFSGQMNRQETAAVKAAFAVWGAATGIQFKEVSNPSQADIQVGLSDFDTDSTGVVGYTTLQTSDGQIQSATVRIEDSSETSLVAGANGQLTYSGTDATLTQTLLHEIGHALGFTSNDDPTSIMNYALGNGNESFDKTDLSGVNSFFGQNSSLAQINQLIQAAASFGTAPGALVTTLATAAAPTATHGLLLAAKAA